MSPLPAAATIAVRRGPTSPTRSAGIVSPDLISTQTGTSQQTLRWLLSFRNIPFRVHFLNFQSFTRKYSRSGTGVSMGNDENTIERRASETALAFGSLI